ncbi:MAG: hypothetical protein R2744_11910 [Bacteroidales bacterium]
MPELIFDHDEMVEVAKEMLKQRVKVQPVEIQVIARKIYLLCSFRISMKLFTSEKMDKRNFRKKKFLSMNLV